MRSLGRYLGTNRGTALVAAFLAIAGLGGLIEQQAWGSPHHSSGQCPSFPAPVGIGGEPVADRHGGGGTQPDPLTLFNQHVELADGEWYALKGQVVLAPGLLGGSRKEQAYFTVDLTQHPWLASKSKDAALYLIEGPLSAWRPLVGAYGTLAAEAHVQALVSSDGTARQVITLKPIPELCSFPRN